MRTIWLKLTFADDSDVERTMKKIHDATLHVMMSYESSTEGPI